MTNSTTVVSNVTTEYEILDRGPNSGVQLVEGVAPATLRVEVIEGEARIEMRDAENRSSALRDSYCKRDGTQSVYHFRCFSAYAHAPAGQRVRIRVTLFG